MHWSDDDGYGRVGVGRWPSAHTATTLATATTAAMNMTMTTSTAADAAKLSTAQRPKKANQRNRHRQAYTFLEETVLESKNRDLRIAELEISEISYRERSV